MVVVLVGSVVVDRAVIVLRSPWSNSRGSLAAVLSNNWPRLPSWVLGRLKTAETRKRSLNIIPSYLATSC